MSLRKAINNMCYSCLYDANAKGTRREQIINCTAINCALFNVRPGAVKTKSNRGVKKLTPEHLEKLKKGRQK